MWSWWLPAHRTAWLHSFSCLEAGHTGAVLQIHVPSRTDCHHQHQHRQPFGGTKQLSFKVATMPAHRVPRTS